MEVEIYTKESSITLLKKQLEKEIPSGNFYIKSRNKSRGIDPTVLVAVIGAASTTISALITGIFALRAARSAKKIVLENADGTKIEIPMDFPIEQAKELLSGKDENKVRRIEILR